jgi:hypothetical protein
VASEIEEIQQILEYEAMVCGAQFEMRPIAKELLVQLFGQQVETPHEPPIPLFSAEIGPGAHQGTGVGHKVIPTEVELQGLPKVADLGCQAVLELGRGHARSQAPLDPIADPPRSRIGIPGRALAGSHIANPVGDPPPLVSRRRIGRHQSVEVMKVVLPKKVRLASFGS